MRIVAGRAKSCSQITHAACCHACSSAVWHGKGWLNSGKHLVVRLLLGGTHTLGIGLQIASHRGSFLADEQGLGGSAFSRLSASRQAWARVWMRSSGHVLCPWPSVILSLPLRKTGLFSDKPPSERFVLNGGDSGETGKCFVLGHRIETADLRRSACCS